MNKDAIAITLCLALHIFFSACGSAAPPESNPHPAWVEGLITRLESEDVANPPAKIVRYQYRGETVYYLPPRCCDVQGVLYDSTGNVICAPDGGITGRGDGRCPDFFAEAGSATVIWEDERIYP